MLLGDKAFEESLGVDYQRGISASEVEERRAKYGSAHIEQIPAKG